MALNPYALSAETIDITSYMSGNGVPYIAQWYDAATEPEEADFVALGEAVEFTINPKVTKKNHKSHSTGVRAIDDRVSVYQEGELKVTLSNFVAQTLQLYWMSTINEDTSHDIMDAMDFLYWLRFDQVLRRGTPCRYDFYKVDLMAAAALNLLADGEGEGDWGRLELTGFMLKDATLGWGKITPMSLVPTT